MNERKHLDGSTEQITRTISMPHSTRAKPEPTVTPKRLAKLQELAAAAGSAFSERRANFLHRAGIADSVVDALASRPPSVPEPVDPGAAFVNILAVAERARVA